VQDFLFQDYFSHELIIKKNVWQRLRSVLIDFFKLLLRVDLL